MNKSPGIIATCFLGACLLCLAAPRLHAQTLLVNRGLPTANLNNAAGSDRSNVAWEFVNDPSDLTDYWLVGDNFTNTTSESEYISTIRLWTVGDTAPVSPALWGGLDGTTIGIASTSASITNVTYADGSLYQGTSGSYIPIQQLDFSVNLTLGAGQTYDFFLDGTPDDPASIPFVHASNAALSGSPQQGADDLMLFGYVTGGSITPVDMGSWDSNGDGWDKSSDVNVDVFGKLPDPASTAMLLGLALSGLGALRARARRRS
jgi:hypothetical protein